jgi:hypothetical protein
MNFGARKVLHVPKAPSSQSRLVTLAEVEQARQRNTRWEIEIDGEEKGARKEPSQSFPPTSIDYRRLNKCPIPQTMREYGTGIAILALSVQVMGRACLR